MKKFILGIAALTSIVSISENLKGNLEFNTNLSLYNEKKDFKAEPKTSKLTNELKLQSYFMENNDVLVFGGFKRNLFDKKRNANIILNDSGNYYTGIRLDTKINDNFDLNVMLATKNGYTKILSNVSNKIIEDKLVLEDNVVAHLKTKNNFDAKRFKDDKNDYLEDNAYKLHSPEDTLVFGATTRGKVDKVNMVLGLTNSSKGLVEPSTETFIKLSGDINEIVKANGYAKYLINKDNKNYFGNLKVNAEIETLLSKNLTLKDSVKLELGNLKSKHTAPKYRDERDVELNLDNSVVYTGIKDLKLTGELNYKANINNKALKTENNGKTNEGDVLHTPVLKVGAEYTYGDFKVSTKESLEGKYKHRIGDIKAKIKLSDSIIFKTDNKLEYKYDKFNFTFDVNHDLRVFGSSDVGLKNKLFLEIGPTIKYSNTTLKSELGLRYLLQKTGKNNLFHRQFAWLKNDYNVKVMNNDITASLNIYDYYKAGKNSVLIILADTGVKVVNNSIDKLTNTLDLKAKYGYYKNINKHALNTMLNLESKYNYAKNIDIIGGLKTEYKLNALGLDLYKETTQFIINSTKIDNTYYDKVGDYLEKISNDKIKNDVLKQKSELENSNKQHDLVLTPSIGASVRFVEGRLELLPKLETKVNFTNKEDVNRKLMFKSVEGKFIFNIKYNW